MQSNHNSGHTSGNTSDGKSADKPVYKKVAYLGMGIMGTAMACNLAKAGVPLKIWNRTPDRAGSAAAQAAGAEIAASITEAVNDASIIFTCLSDVPDVEEVLIGKGGVIGHAPQNSIIVDMSTIGPNAARELSFQLAKANIHFLDAPVTGGDVGARAGTLTIMVGGDENDLAVAKPYLEIMGKNIKYCGPTGSGQAVKLCNQVLCAVNMVSLCEALTLAEKLGVDPKLVVDVCSTGAGGSWALSNLGPKILQGDLAPAFMIKHLMKDLNLIQESLKNSLKDSSKNSMNDLPGTMLADKNFKQVAAMDNGTAKNQGTQAMIRAYKIRVLG